MRNYTGIGAKVAAAFAVTTGLYACLKTEEFPPEPHIEFKSFELFANDSASLVITFTDGDGDIGLGDGDTVAPYDANLFMDYFELENGVWNDVDLGGSPQITYRVPVITPTGQNKTLEGEIAISLEPFTLHHTASADTVKYGVKLLDRALHESNVVETGAILVP